MSFGGQDPQQPKSTMTYRKPARPRLNRNSPLSRGLIVAWGFEEGAGTRTRAIRGNRWVHGQAAGGASFSDITIATDGYTWVTSGAAPDGNAIPGHGLKNTTNARALNAFLDPRPDPDFTIAWTVDVNIPAATTRTHFQANRTNNAGQSLGQVLVTTTGVITFSDSYGSSASSAAGAMTEGHHTVVYTRQARETVVYVDGAVALTATATSDPTAAGQTQVRWGTNISGGNGWDQTVMYGAAVWNRALTASEVLHHSADPFEVVRGRDLTIPFQLLLADAGVRHASVTP